MTDQRKWGQWTLDTSDMTLTYADDDDFEYWIDLYTITSSTQMLDWIFQISRKGWADAMVMKSLLDAFHHIFHPQENLCSFGQDRRINAKEFLRSHFSTEDAA